MEKSYNDIKAQEQRVIETAKALGKFCDNKNHSVDIQRIAQITRNALCQHGIGFFGYDPNKNQGAQTPQARYALFWMCTLLPVVSGILSIVPQLFYDLSGEKRDRMYQELRERRKAMKSQVDEYNDSVGNNNA